MRRLQRAHTLATLLAGPLLLVGVAFIAPVNGQEGENRAPSDGKPAAKRFTPSGPSIIPHPIYDIPCLTCHKTERSVATRIPHPPYPHCLQCHVVQVDVKPYRKNLFADRIKESAKPPVIPAKKRADPKSDKAKPSPNPQKAGSKPPP